MIVNRLKSVYFIVNALVCLFVVMLPNAPNHGGEIALILVFMSMYLIFKEKIEKLDSSSKIFLIFICSLFSLYLIGAIWQPIGMENLRFGANIDNQLRWVLFIPVFFVFRFVEVPWKVLSLAVALSSLIGLGIALYQVYILDIERAQAFNHPISFGQMMVILDLLSWMLMIHAVQLKNLFYSVLLLISSLAGFYASLLSSTRGAWLAYIIMLCVWGVLLYRSKQLNYKSLLKGQVLLRLAAMTIIFILVSQTDQFKIAENKTVSELNGLSNQNFQSSAGLRLLMWQVALKSSIEFPFGVGTGNFNAAVKYVTDHQLVDFSNKEVKSLLRYSHAHNQYLNILAENGWLALIVFISFQIFLIRYFWRNMVAQNAVVKIYSSMGLLLVLGFTVFYMTQVVFSHHVMNLFFVFFLYLLFAQVQYYKKKE